MQIIQKLDELNQRYGIWLFYIGLVLMNIGGGWFWFTDVPPVIKLFKLQCLAIGSYFCYARIILLLRQYPIYSALSLLILAGFYWVSHNITKDAFIYLSLIPIFAARGAKIKNVLFIFIGVFISLLFVVPLFYKLGWAADIQKHTFSLVGHSWGFGTPNLLGLLLTSLLFAVLCMWQPNNKKVWITCIVGAIVIGATTLCSTAVVSVLAFPIFLYLNQKYKIRPIYWAIAPILCFFISLGLSLYYGPSLGNTTFESRFSMPYMLYEEIGLKWFGQNCNLISLRTVLKEGIDAICLDNTYLRLPIQYGIIPGIITYLLLGFNIYLIAKQRSPFFLAVALCFLLIGFSETVSLMVRLNFSLLVGLIPLSMLAKEKERKDDKGKEQND